MSSFFCIQIQALYSVILQKLNIRALVLIYHLGVWIYFQEPINVSKQFIRIHYILETYLDPCALLVSGKYNVEDIVITCPKIIGYHFKALERNIFINNLKTIFKYVAMAPPCLLWDFAVHFMKLERFERANFLCLHDKLHFSHHLQCGICS